ncbi:MAG: hypothetical protein SVU94_10050 [Bacteroidota bacterium]|nr:hypothetical protein [Bacteroidota bacterium]
MGFPFSQALLKREELICIGTTQAALLALENGVSFNVAGAPIMLIVILAKVTAIYNDSAVAAQYLLTYNKVKQILVVDLEVH